MTNFALRHPYFLLWLISEWEAHTKICRFVNLELNTRKRKKTHNISLHKVNWLQICDRRISTEKEMRNEKENLARHRHCCAQWNLYCISKWKKQQQLNVSFIRRVKMGMNLKECQIFHWFDGKISNKLWPNDNDCATVKTRTKNTAVTIGCTNTQCRRQKKHHAIRKNYSRKRNCSHCDSR